MATTAERQRTFADYPDLPVAQRLGASGPKRMLALDGGGVRGVVTVAFLKELERQLRTHTGRRDLVLSDVFDFVGGTSVGAMLAVMVALGKETAEIDSVFKDLAPKIFSGRRTIVGQKRFDARNLVNGVRSIVRDATLGSPLLRCGLLIMAKRVNTGSVWAMTNHPLMPFYEDGPTHEGNKNYKLEAVIRASTAAPFLFSPAEITIHTDRQGNKEQGWFVDGGVSPHNNPSYQLLLMAALKAYRLQWPLGPEKLLMISIGTGMHRTVIDPKTSKQVMRGLLGRLAPKELREDIEEAAFAANALRGMIADAALLTLKTMQSISETRFNWRINTEIQDLKGDDLLASLNVGPLLRFQRLDLPLERAALVPDPYHTDAPAEVLLALHAIDEPANMGSLSSLAEDVARRQVSMKDFEGFL